MSAIENDTIFSEDTFALKPLSSLKTWERNYRKGDVDAIAASISRFGFNGALRVWQDNAVMAGNHALLALRQLRDSGSPAPFHVAEVGDERFVKTIDLSHLNRFEAQAFAIADNHTQEIGSNDDAALASLLQSIAEQDATAMAATGYDDAAVKALLESVAAMEPPNDGDWNAATGNLPTGDKSPFQQMTFTLHDTQAEIVKDAIERAKAAGAFVETGNENSNGNALARICEAYDGTS